MSETFWYFLIFAGIQLQAWSHLVSDTGLKYGLLTAGFIVSWYVLARMWRQGDFDDLKVLARRVTRKG